MAQGTPVKRDGGGIGRRRMLVSEGELLRHRQDKTEGIGDIR